jgi:ZIP family zinc transporter
MSFLSTVILGGIAGLTIYLGLPVARLKNLSRAWQAFLGAVAVGILIFLLWDVLSQAIAPIEEAIDAAKQGEPFNFISLLALFSAGLGIGLLSLVYFDRILMRLTGRHIQPDKIAPARLALMIAGGIGLHNFSEGLAIGQASRAGAISLAAILIVGFGLHNATEGFGVAAPLTSGERPTWRFLALLGLIAGGPTFLGTVVGFSVYSQPIFVLCLALAAGSILYVVAELLKLHPQMRELIMWGILIGFLIAYGTDLILMWGGA